MVLTIEISRLAARRAGDLTISELCLGLGYTGVKLSDGSGGCCFSCRGELGPQCGTIANAGNLTGMRASEAIALAGSINLSEAALGVATATAILNRDYTAGPNAIEVMEVRPGDRIGMIGYFHPVVQQFKERARELLIFERNVTAEGLLPDWSEDMYLPTCDVVVITGVTFINKTIDHILALSRKAKEVVIMGASTLMEPETLREYGVTLLAGSRVVDPDRLLRIISQGGGGLDIIPCTEKLCQRIAARRD